MTTYEIACMVWVYYRKRLNFYERKLLEKLMDGISGLGQINDVDIQEYLSEKQIKFIRQLGKRFRIK